MMFKTAFDLTGGVCLLMSFRGDTKCRTTVRNCAPENLEIPGSRLRRAPE